MEKTNIPNTHRISRRKFLITSGGFALFVSSGSLASQYLMGKDKPKQDEAEKENKELNIWAQLDQSGKITIYNPAAEMGQGSMTALAVIIAEELDADWNQVHIENAPVKPDLYGLAWRRGGQKNMLTVGSRTVRGFYHDLRQAGAQARYVLLYSVAQKWNVPINELRTEPSQVIHAPSNKKISYGAIASFIQMPTSIPEIPEEQLKKPEQFRLIGQNIPRFDIPAKVRGAAQYSIDVQLPNMVYGVVSRSPMNGAAPQSFNQAEIQAMTGVLETIQLAHGIAIIADSMEAALRSKKALKIEWDQQVKSSSHSSDEAYQAYAENISKPNPASRTVHEEGNVSEAKAKADKVYRFDYKNDYVYHAQMEPLNAVVSLGQDSKSAEAWVGTQSPDRALDVLARSLGMDKSQITLHLCYLGGGFGRRSMTDYIAEAATLAQKVRRPLKLIWTREDDVQYGAFRPMSLQRMQAGLDKQGNIISWEHAIMGTGGGLLGSGANIPFYSIPNQKIEVKSIEHGIRTKHWRSVAHGPNKFAIEAFLDEIAQDQGLDPYTFRRKLMKDSPRALKVLDTAAQMADWNKARPADRALGIAFAERSGSLSAGVCEISLDEQRGKIKVHHFWVSLDAGVVVQPDNAIAQMEGSIIFGLSSVFGERISFKGGVVEQSNFHNYQLLRFRDVPESLEVKIIESSEDPAGIGEAGLPVVAGAIANAFAQLTGKNVRHLPFSPNKVKEVLRG